MEIAQFASELSILIADPDAASFCFVAMSQRSETARSVKIQRIWRLLVKLPYRLSAVLLAVLSLTAVSVNAGDWPRFRGPNGDGISTEGPIPTKWDLKSNLKWKSNLPGKGSSSPIVLGDRVFVTCYSGYGEAAGGDDANLARQLVCVDRTSGKITWTKTVKNAANEDRYQGFITEHGYASGTPVTDGKHVYAFFGKSGVYAYDLEGNEIWNVRVGTSSSNRHWGSAASLIVHGDSVIVNASEESRSIIALDRKTGKEIWKTEADLLELAYGTPKLIKSDDRELLVLAVPQEVWALNPDNGKLAWYCETKLPGNISPSVNSTNGMIYVTGGFPAGGSVAFKADGKGDITSNIAWTSRDSSYVATPVLHEGHLYWIDDKGVAFCTNAETGKTVYRERLVGGGGRPVYASPVLCDGKLFVPSRWEGVFVLDANPEFKLLAQNKFEDDES
ncbi:MAG: outer membrane protein assembly factor BamB [Planctomycetaceae bacterium]|jgi:outer membrane protein assembly factor BamB